MTHSNLDLARECGVYIHLPGGVVFNTLTKLDAFAERIRADERASIALPAGMPEPFGYILHWPSPGGGRVELFSTTRTAGDSIGCPVTVAYTAAQVQAMLAQGLKHVCNLWVDPETKRFVVDRCDHPLDQLVPAYIAAAHQTPAAVEPAMSDKPLTPFLIKTNKEHSEWLAKFYAADTDIERFNRYSLWAWQEQERRYAAPQPLPVERKPLIQEQYTELAHRIASKYTHRSDTESTAYTFLPHTLEQFVRSIEATAQQGGAE